MADPRADRRWESGARSIELAWLIFIPDRGLLDNRRSQLVELAFGFEYRLTGENTYSVTQLGGVVLGVWALASIGLMWCWNVRGRHRY